MGLDKITWEEYQGLGLKDKGRGEVKGFEALTGFFKVPSLRNVTETAPYMHDGSLKTLEEVVEIYAKGGHPNDHLSEKIKKLDLSDQDKQDRDIRQECGAHFVSLRRNHLFKLC